MTTLTTEELLKRATLNVVTPLSDETLRRFLEAHHIARQKTDFAGTSYNTLGALNSAAWAGENLHFLFAEIVRLRRMAASWEAMREFAALFDAYDKENCQSGKITWEEMRLSCHRALALSNGEEPAQ